MLKNTETYTTLNIFNGDTINGDGHDCVNLPEMAALIASEDTANSHVVQVTRITFDERGRATTSDVSSDVADMVAALYSDRSICTSHEHFVSPLVTQWTDWEPEVHDEYSFIDWRREHGLTAAQVV